MIFSDCDLSSNLRKESTFERKSVYDEVFIKAFASRVFLDNRRGWHRNGFDLLAAGQDADIRS